MSSADTPKKSSGYIRWLLGRKRVLVVDDVREQLTLAADIIDELAEKNQKLGDASPPRRGRHCHQRRHRGRSA